MSHAPVTWHCRDNVIIANVYSLPFANNIIIVVCTVVGDVVRSQILISVCLHGYMLVLT